MPEPWQARITLGRKSDRLTLHVRHREGVAGAFVVAAA
jgi:hypothetical protein